MRCRPRTGGRGRPLRRLLRPPGGSAAPCRHRPRLPPTPRSRRHRHRPLGGSAAPCRRRPRPPRTPRFRRRRPRPPPTPRPRSCPSHRQAPRAPTRLPQWASRFSSPLSSWPLEASY
ncbi:MAG: hypothetical protein DI576_08925 [Actinomyces sp.]|nr:MAG: hypothetical protein DI576_08925 [Actinomyces sp.]